MTQNAGVPIFAPTAVAVAAHSALTSGVHGITAAGAALIDDADAAAQRTTLGLVIGSNVQAQDAELQAIAGLTSAADKLPYFTGSGTAALADCTAAGRALLDDATAAAQRTTLDVPGLNTANTITGIQTIQAAATQDAIKIAGRAGGTGSFSATIIPLVLTANRTLSAPDADGTIALLGANTFTGVQLIPAGTAAAPSIAFSSDTDTGLFRSVSNVLGVSCGGTASVTIESNALYKVGYGTQQAIAVRHANGTEAAPTKTLSGDYVGGLSCSTFYDDGVGGTGFIGGTGIRFYATEDRSASTARGQRTTFLTIPNGSSSGSTRSVLTEKGSWLHGAVFATSQEITLTSLGTYPRFQIFGTSVEGQSALLQARFDATAGDCPQHVLAKSRGTALEDYTAVASGDTLGIWAGEGADGTEFIRAGSIRCVVDGTVSTGVVPGRWDFYTNNASGTGTLALRIDSSQNLTPYGDVLLQTGKVLKVAGTKVVGAQGSAIADVTTADATDLASAIALANANKAKINSILAMVRTHGLIAT